MPNSSVAWAEQPRGGGVKMQQRKRFCGLSCESEGHHLALTVLHVLCSLDSGNVRRARAIQTREECGPLSSQHSTYYMRRARAVHAGPKALCDFTLSPKRVTVQSRCPESPDAYIPTRRASEY